MQNCGYTGDVDAPTIAFDAVTVTILTLAEEPEWMRLSIVRHCVADFGETLVYGPILRAL